MQKKIDWIDLMRGIAIFLVVLGHSITHDMADNSVWLYYVRLFIYTIHMPMFFVISGWLFEMNNEKYRSKTVWNYIISKFKVFMIPYIMFSVLNYIIIFVAMQIPQAGSVLIKQGYSAITIVQAVFSVLTYINHQDSHLWFCYVMFLILCINRLLIPKNGWKTLIFLLVIYIISYYVSAYLPEVVYKTMRYLLIFAAGRFLYNYKKFDKKREIILLVLSIVSFVVYAVFTRLDVAFFVYIAKIVFEVSATALFLLICSKFNFGKIVRLFKYLGTGKISYAIYLIHMPFLTSFLVFALEKIHIPCVFVILFSTVLSLIISLAVYKVVSKSRIISIVFFADDKKS